MFANKRQCGWQPVVATRWRRAEERVMAVQVTITTDNRVMRFNNMEYTTQQHGGKWI